MCSNYTRGQDAWKGTEATLWTASGTVADFTGTVGRQATPLTPCGAFLEHLAGGLEGIGAARGALPRGWRWFAHAGRALPRRCMPLPRGWRWFAHVGGALPRGWLRGRPVWGRWGQHTRQGGTDAADHLHPRGKAPPRRQRLPDPQSPQPHSPRPAAHTPRGPSERRATAGQDPGPSGIPGDLGGTVVGDPEGGPAGTLGGEAPAEAVPVAAVGWRPADLGDGGEAG
jgi:hypothetical protein